MRDSESEASQSDDSYDSYKSESNDDSVIEHNQVDFKTFFNVKELCYYKMIDKFFNMCTEDNINKMLDIIEGKSPISLRILDWFATKYSKKNIDTNREDGEIFDVKISYKSQLKAYKKRYFDPFRRRKKFRYMFCEDKKLSADNIYTTLGQLNFFKWIFSNHILNYVDKNLKQICKEMNQSNKDDKQRKKDKVSDVIPVKKSKDIIKINPTRMVETTQSQIVLMFD